MAKLPLIVSLYTRDAAALPPAAALAAYVTDRFAPPVALHLATPDVRTVTREAMEAAKRIGDLTQKRSLQIISGGWCGAAGALITPSELLWEWRWSLTNPENTGVEQIFRVQAAGFFPQASCEYQLEGIPEDTTDLICCGYPPEHCTTASRGVAPFFVRHRGVWREHQALLVRYGEAPRHRDHLPGYTMVHLVLEHRQLHLPDVPEVGDTLLDLLSRCTLEEPPEGRPPAGTMSSGTREDLSGALYLRAPGTIHARGTCGHRPNGTRTVLSCASLLGVSEAGAPLPPAELPDFQGTTDGAFTLDEPGGVTVVTRAGRPGGITLPDGTPVMTGHLWGYARNASGILPEIRYLESHGAAWYSGTGHRAVREESSLTMGSSRIALSLSTVTIDHRQGFFFPWVMTLPFPGLSRATWTAAPLLLPLNTGTAHGPVAVEAVDCDGKSTVVHLREDDTPVVVPAWYVRIPVAGGPTVLLAAADPGNRAIMPWLLRRNASRGETVVALGYHGSGYHGSGLPETPHPMETRETVLRGTYVVAPGNTPEDLLHVDFDAAPFVMPFNRTDPA